MVTQVPDGAATVSGDTVVAIGDVHGTVRLLDAMLDALDAWEPEAPLVFLGDLVDRGPDARGAIERAMRATARRTGSRLLLGNHEDFMLRAVAGDDEAMELWLPQGGAETLRSFGVDPHGSWTAIRDAMRAKHGEVIEVVRAWPRMAWGEGAAEGHAFAHAGIDPHAPLDDQDERDLIWMRQPFLDWPHALERRIVHGHTIEGRRPVLRDHRIGIDTGAYDTGVLTALVLKVGDEPRFLATRSEGDRIVVGEARPRAA